MPILIVVTAEGYKPGRLSMNNYIWWSAASVSSNSSDA